MYDSKIPLSSHRQNYLKMDEKEKKNLSTISIKPDNIQYEGHNQIYREGMNSLHSNNDDYLYKQYKSNMMNSMNTKPLQTKEQIHSERKKENENKSIEITLPIKTKSEDQDDWIRELTITMTITYLSPSKQLISISITDPIDPLFLYQVDIGEQEFHFLKQELSLLIEFQHFPQKFFEMLELCCQHGGTNINNFNSTFKENINDSNILNKSLLQSQSNYICILHNNSNSSEALLIIQELTQFRQLNHLILRLKSATDSVLKKYLCNLVREYKNKSENFSKENTKLSENLESVFRELRSSKDELTNIKNLHFNELENYKIEHFKELNETKEKMFEDTKNKLEAKEIEKISNIEELENKLTDLRNKLEFVTQEKLNLEDLRIKLEAKERDLEGKNTIMNSELKVYKDEVEKLRNTSTNLNQSNFHQEKTLTEYRVKYELLIQQLEEKEKNINNLSLLVENLNKQKSEIEDYLKSSKSINNKLEDKLQASIAEINKGNEIIQKLQTELKSQKEKIKLKNQGIKAQEQLINQKQIAIEELNKNNTELKREIDKKEEEIKSNKYQIENYKLKLDEAQKLLEENEKVIRFLNSNLNASYLPFKNVLKNETTLGSATLTSQLNSLKKTKDENQSFLNNNYSNAINNQINTNEVFANTGTSFAKQPYFNSMAFNSGASFGVNNNTMKQATGKYQTNYAKSFSSSNLNEMILPETNFSGYKNLLSQNDKFNVNTESPSSKVQTDPDVGNSKYVNTNLNLNNNSNFTPKNNQINTGSKSQLNNLLGHKYGVTLNKSENHPNSENYLNDYNKNLNSNFNTNLNLNSHEEEEQPRPNPVLTADKNIFQYKIFNN